MITIKKKYYTAHLYLHSPHFLTLLHRCQDMLVERLTAALEREAATLKTLQEAKQEETELAQALKERARLQEEELLHLGK